MTGAAARPAGAVADWLLRHGFVLIMVGFFLFFALTAKLVPHARATCSTCSRATRSS